MERSHRVCIDEFRQCGEQKSKDNRSGVSVRFHLGIRRRSASFQCVNPFFRRILITVILVCGLSLFVYFGMVVKTPYVIIVPAVFLLLFWLDTWRVKRKRVKRRMARRERAQQRLSETPPISNDH